MDRENVWDEAELKKAMDNWGKAEKDSGAKPDTSGKDAVPQNRGNAENKADSQSLKDAEKKVILQSQEVTQSETVAQGPERAEDEAADADWSQMEIKLPEEDWDDEEVNLSPEDWNDEEEDRLSPEDWDDDKINLSSENQDNKESGDSTSDGSSENAVNTEAGEPQPEKKKRKKLHIVLPLIAAAIVAVYLIVCFFYMKHYLPNTVINGIDCSSKTVEVLKENIANEVDGYELTIVERDGGTETVSGSQINLEVVFDGTFEELLDEQQAFAWPLALFSGSNYEPGSTVVYEDEQLEAVLLALNCADEAQMTVTQDAQIVFSEETEAFEIEPPVYGTYLEADDLYAAVNDAIISLAESLNLEEAGCYEDPTYTEESEELLTACSEMNDLISVNITYDMLDIGTIEITKEEMSAWVALGNDFSVSVDEEAVAAYVASFAEEYDTQYTDHTLKTTWGSTVTISKGSYGWKLDQEAETAALLEEMAAGEDVTREPNYSHTAASHGENDYGDTYVEINLTAQHLYFYKDGVLVVESDFVSGDVSDGNATPTGIYPVTYTQRNATLRGDNYETPVSYWMPFNGGVGMHDATWRSSFGGSIYKTNGSHGCINLPLSVAKTIYENIKKGDPVLVYTLSGTESSKTSYSYSSGSGSGTSSTSDSGTSSESSSGTSSDNNASTSTDSGNGTSNSSGSGNNPSDTTSSGSSGESGDSSSSGSSSESGDSGSGSDSGSSESGSGGSGDSGESGSSGSGDSSESDLGGSGDGSESGSGSGGETVGDNAD